MDPVSEIQSEIGYQGKWLLVILCLKKEKNVVLCIHVSHHIFKQIVLNDYLCHVSIVTKTIAQGIPLIFTKHRKKSLGLSLSLLLSLSCLYIQKIQTILKKVSKVTSFQGHSTGNSTLGLFTVSGLN